MCLPHGRCFLSLYISFVLCVISTGQPQTSEKHPNCLRHEEITRVAYKRWMLQVGCDSSIFMQYEYDDEDYYSYNEESQTSYTCIIWNLEKNVLLINVTATSTDIDDISYKDYNVKAEPQAFLVQMVAQDSGTCKEILYNYTVIYLPKQNCQENINFARKTKWHIGIPEILTCTTSISGIPIPPNTTITWYKNCRDLPETVFQIKKGVFKNSLRFPSVEYEHSGVYTCAVTYNGQRMFLKNYDVCIRPPTYTGRPKIGLKCQSEEISTKLDQDVVFACEAKMFFGSIDRSDITIRWIHTVNNKNTTPTCVNGIALKVNSTVRSGSSCSFEFPDKCYSHNATIDERSYTPLVLPLRFNIRNVKETDLGVYELQVKTLDLQNNVSIALNFSQDKSSLVVGLAVSLGALFFLLLLVFILWWNRIYVSVIYKRKFGPYTKDTKDFGAFLSYQFTMDMDRFSQQQTRDVVSSTVTALNDIRFTVFDQHKDIGGEFMAEKAIQSMSECHRVIIILTSEYIKDNWSVFSLQQSFMKMIDSGRKVIFILVPGIQEFIKQKGSENETCRMIDRAIKLNDSILWSDNKHFNKNKFKLMLEKAMPKVRPNNRKGEKE